MINKDFQEYPEHRTNFYLMLQQVVAYCFPALLTIPPAQFKLVLDSIIWAIKHTMRNVADTGLQILSKLIENICQEEAAMQGFFQTYFTDILQHLFSVATDSSHSAGLSLQSSLLAYLFHLVESGKISVPLNPGVSVIPGENVAFVQTYVANLLKTAFPHLTDAQIKITVQGFFNLDQDHAAFKEHLRDFLVQIKVRIALFCFVRLSYKAVRSPLSLLYVVIIFDSLFFNRNLLEKTTRISSWRREKHPLRRLKPKREPIT